MWSCRNAPTRGYKSSPRTYVSRSLTKIIDEGIWKVTIVVGINLTHGSICGVVVVHKHYNGI
jgi:hypothetical protein